MPLIYGKLPPVNGRSSRRTLWAVAALVLCSPVASDAADEVFTADLHTLTQFSDGRLITARTRYQRLGDRVRLDPEKASPEGYEEHTLYDFEKNRLLRIFPQDRIYFEAALSPFTRQHAIREGWIDRERDRDARWRSIFLKDDTFEGYDCAIYLVERAPGGAGGRRPTEYSLVWEAKQLGRAIRVVYPQGAGTTVIVEYRNPKVEPGDPKLFDPPEGYLNLSPF